MKSIFYTRVATLTSKDVVVIDIRELHAQQGMLTGEGAEVCREHVLHACRDASQKELDRDKESRNKLRNKIEITQDKSALEKMPLIKSQRKNKLGQKKSKRSRKEKKKSLSH